MQEKLENRCNTFLSSFSTKSNWQTFNNNSICWLFYYYDFRAYQGHRYPTGPTEQSERGCPQIRRQNQTAWGRTQGKNARITQIKVNNSKSKKVLKYLLYIFLRILKMIYYLIFRAETANAKLQVDKVASERDVLKSKNEALEAMETELTDQVCYLFIWLIAVYDKSYYSTY